MIIFQNRPCRVKNVYNGTIGHLTPSFVNRFLKTDTKAVMEAAGLICLTGSSQSILITSTLQLQKNSPTCMSPRINMKNIEKTPIFVFSIHIRLIGHKI